MLCFLGISATAGGVALVGGDFVPPSTWLSDIPVVDSWLVPGLVLGLGFGVGSLVTAYGMARKSRWPWLDAVEQVTGYHWSWLATLLIGAGHAVWIGLEPVRAGNATVNEAPPAPAIHPPHAIRLPYACR